MFRVLARYIPSWPYFGGELRCTLSRHGSRDDALLSESFVPPTVEPRERAVVGLKNLHHLGLVGTQVSHDANKRLRDPIPGLTWSRTILFVVDCALAKEKAGRMN
jgi:hypothetical protein